MRSMRLAVTLIGNRFSLTPLPRHIQSGCAGGDTCTEQASHRLVRRAAATLLCDAHTLAWARNHGCAITTGEVAPAVRES